MCGIAGYCGRFKPELLARMSAAVVEEGAGVEVAASGSRGMVELSGTSGAARASTRDC
jgi:hypothetical protein